MHTFIMTDSSTGLYSDTSCTLIAVSFSLHAINTRGNMQVDLLNFIDLELAIDPPAPRGSFVHYDFLKVHYIRNKMTHVSPLYVGALTCNVNVNYTTQNYILRLR